MTEKLITHRRTTPIKKRSSSCYQNKCKKLEKLWNDCPKIQAKYTLEQWLSKIKQPTKE